MEMSESITNLSTALALFQAEVKNPANSAKNPFFNSSYAPLSDVLNDVRPLLSKNGLSVLQFPGGDGENISITPLLLHSSGEWIRGNTLTLRADKATAQGAGSAITYARRYSLSAILGISSEDDDDGNHATKPDKNKSAAKKPTQQTTEQSSQQTPSELASDKQRGMIFGLSKKLGMDTEMMKMLLENQYHIKSSKELTKQQATAFIKQLQEYEQTQQTSGTPVGLQTATE